MVSLAVVPALTEALRLASPAFAPCTVKRNDPVPPKLTTREALISVTSTDRRLVAEPAIRPAVTDSRLLL